MVSGQKRTLYHKWRYIVRIDGIDGEAGFGKAGPLKGTHMKVEYRSGGAKIPYKDAGMMEFPTLTLERGSTEDDDLYEWFLEVANAASDSGSSRDDYLRNLVLEQLDNERKVVKRYKIYNAFVVGFQAGDWDSSANEVNIEQLEIEYDYFEIETLV